ncbi:hypothetical protein ON010_g11066 [Phytophthora cinnamomi]|nr:hypothetical protein ON010_g11066 [Phytophthora cinnamomi]
MRLWRTELTDEDPPATWTHAFLAARLVRPAPEVCSPHLEEDVAAIQRSCIVERLDPTLSAKPRISVRAFVVQDSEPDSDLEPERLVRFEELDDEGRPVTPAAQVALAQRCEHRAAKAPRAEQQPVFKTEDVAKGVYRVRS